MHRVELLVRRVATAVSALPILRQDALLYVAAGVFALGETAFAVTRDYREWGAVAAAPYLVAALACEVAHRLASRRNPRGGEGAPQGESRTGLRVRHLVIIVLFGLTVMLPLGQQIAWRAAAPLGRTNLHSAQAQPEVAVIERAGDRAASFRNPYLSHPKTVGVSPSNDSRSVNATSFFPYLPGMIPFGLANAADVPRGLNDARLELAGFSLVVLVLALALAPVASRRRWRTFQFFVVLPTGALPMVTGGDDLPVLALLLLGLVFVARRQPVLAGVVMGLAGTLKWTAWPLILLAALCARDEEGRSAFLRYSFAMGSIAVPVVGAGFALNPHAFLENVVLFPLGLTKVHSPAASPLPGQILVNLFPAAKRQITEVLVAAGIIAVLVALVRYRPKTASGAAWFAGCALAFATFIAPATRFGYLIYPANMFVWAYLLDPRALRLGARVRPLPACQPQAGGSAHPTTAQLASST